MSCFIALHRYKYVFVIYIPLVYIPISTEMNKAASTRKYILERAFELIYKNGFQATSIDHILETTSVTKGAFYYHFRNKEDMGVALIQEIISADLHHALIAPLKEYNNPLNGIYQCIRTYMLGLSDKQIRYGCATTNLIQELSALEESYRDTLKKLMDEWQAAVMENLLAAKEKRQIRENLDVNQVAIFIISSYQGARTTGKIFQSQSFFQGYLQELDKYLKDL